MSKKAATGNQIKKSSTPNWYQSFWVKAISTLSIIGLIVALLSDGAQVIDRISGTSEDTSSKEPNGDTQNTNNTDQLKAAKISLSLFTLNSEICHYKQSKLKNNLLQVVSTLPTEERFDFNRPPIVLMDISKGDTSYLSNVEGNENVNQSKIDTIKVNDNNRLPIFDVTLLNEGDENVILNQIKVHVYSFIIPEGDGIAGGGKSYAIKSINRYKVILPELYDIFKKGAGEHREGEFTKEYPALPPLLIGPQAPARFQVQLGNSESSGADYILSFEFLFSNKQSIFSDKIEITF